jgi:CheY-like chemotaxis protein
MAPRAFAKGLELGFFMAQDVPEKAHGDAGRIRQILYNLVGNAIKFTERGGVAISVAPGGRPPRGVADRRFMVRFDVADTGIGIPKDVLPNLFEQFAQADKTIARRYGGTGLGLSISRKLALLMGGTIGVASDDGQGSQFWFTAALAPVRGRSAAEDRGGLAGQRVLVVDDNAVNREIMGHQLAAWQVAVDTADNADTVLPALQQAAREGRGFAAAILDHAMPGLDGLALAERIRAIPEFAALRLILASSSITPETRQGSQDLSLAAVLVKPCSPSALYTALSGLVEPRVATPATAPSLGPAVGAGLRVLIAEDNAVNQVVVKQMLEKLGCRVDAVSNGLEAVEAVRLAPYHLVFMDVQMPEMDGLTATGAIRALHVPGRRDVWIVALTANAMGEDAKRCMDAGMNDFVAKPVRVPDLQAALARIPANVLAQAARGTAAE